MCLLSGLNDLIEVVARGLLRKNGLKCLSYKTYDVYTATCDNPAPSYLSAVRYVLERLYEKGYFQEKILKPRGRRDRSYVYIACEGELYNAIRAKDLEKIKKIIESVL